MKFGIVILVNNLLSAENKKNIIQYNAQKIPISKYKFKKNLKSMNVHLNINEYFLQPKLLLY